jgi:hypothetical protein
MKVEINGIQYIPAPKPAEGKDLDAALDVRFDSDAGSQLTVREYFRELLTTLWEEKEGFSGKRPFGNSGWEYEVHIALAKAGFVDLGEWDDECEGYEMATTEQHKAADAYCRELIKRVFEFR